MNLTIEIPVHFGRARTGEKKLCSGKKGTVDESQPGSVPRVSKLMALAIRFDGIVRQGKVRDYAELAKVGRVSRARLTQIMNLMNLAPEIQEEILFLPRTMRGRDAINEHDIRAISKEIHWSVQIELFQRKPNCRLAEFKPLSARRD